jgi:hypothetical protein
MSDIMAVNENSPTSKFKFLNLQQCKLTNERNEYIKEGHESETNIDMKKMCIRNTKRTIEKNFIDSLSKTNEPANDQKIKQMPAGNTSPIMLFR